MEGVGSEFKLRVRCAWPFIAANDRQKLQIDQKPLVIKKSRLKSKSVLVGNGEELSVLLAMSASLLQRG